MGYPKDSLDMSDFQRQVMRWMASCFGPIISADKDERNHRFLEEALELVQSCGCTAEDAHKLVDYVYGRPVGEKGQEVGGVMVTLAALCLAQELSMHNEAWRELERIVQPEMVEKIRAKQAAKPKFGPLPEHPINPISFTADKLTINGVVITPAGKPIKQHDLKIHPDMFLAVASGMKTSELRINDRDFQVGDLLSLSEWDPQDGKYTGRGAMRTITHILPVSPWAGSDSGWVVLSMSTTQSPWEMAVKELCTISHLGWEDSNPLRSIHKLIEWEVVTALDPAVSPQARELINTGAAAGQQAMELMDLIRQYKLSVYPNEDRWHVDRDVGHVIDHTVCYANDPEVALLDARAILSATTDAQL